VVTLRNHEFAVMAGMMATTWPSARSNEHHPSHHLGYHGVSVFSEWFSSWDAINGHGVDMMHELANMARMVVSLAGNTGQGEYTRAHAREEALRRSAPTVELQAEHMLRVRALAAKQAKQKGKVAAAAAAVAEAASSGGQYEWPATAWQISASARIASDDYCDALRLPHDDVRMPGLFRGMHQSGMQTKSAHWLLWLGPVGVAMVAQWDIPDSSKRHLVRLLWWCNRLQAKSFTATELDDLEAEAPIIFTNLEMIWPRRTNTLAKHYLQHAVHFIRVMGPLWATWM